MLSNPLPTFLYHIFLLFDQQYIVNTNSSNSKERDFEMRSPLNEYYDNEYSLRRIKLPCVIIIIDLQ